MYGFQGNNSQTYNYQNPNGSFGNISQYTGPYHPYYSNATAAYNTFPSNEPPCSSLGVIPQEYSQTGNGIPRPYFYDTSSSYSRSYQGLPFNQSMDLPIANSFNTCPRNCHCCEPLKPKYFNPGNAIHQQANTKSPYDPTLNATYNGLRKGFDASVWRECNPQLSNINEANDSSTSWSLPKYGNGYKNEACLWPSSQRQTSKFESGECMASSNTYILSQQHQRISLPNSQPYSSIHSNSLRPMPTACQSPGTNEELMGSCRVSYQYNSFSDLPKSNVESHSYHKSSVNSVQTSSIPGCNFPCGGSFPNRLSSSSSKVIYESQKCVVEKPKVMAPLSGNLVDSFQRHLPSNNPLEEVKDMSYYQSGMFPSVNPIDVPARRVAPNQNDSSFLLNCNSNESNNPITATRLQLPPIQSLKPSGMILRNTSRNFNQDFSHVTPKSVQQNQCEEFGARDRRNNSLNNAPMRNCQLSVSDSYCANTTENIIEMLPGDEGNSILKSGAYTDQYVEKQAKGNLAFLGDKEGSRKVHSEKNSHGKLTSSSESSGITDLRHFLSTWDDVDEEDTQSSAQVVISDGSKEEIELGSEEIPKASEFLYLTNNQLEKTSICSKSQKNIPLSDFQQKELLAKEASYSVDRSQIFSHTFESGSVGNSENLNETEIIEHELSLTQKSSNELKGKAEITMEHQAKKKFSNFKLNICDDLNRFTSSSCHSKNSSESDGGGCFLGVNTCEEEMGYLDTQKVLAEQRMLETHRSIRECKEILHSSDDTSLNIVSMDLAVRGSSVTQHKSNVAKLHSLVEGTKIDIPLVSKTNSSCDSRTEEKILDHQNGILKETNTESVIISSEKSLIGASNAKNSRNVPLESDTMVFYNLTARLDVTLERLEVPSIPIYERNDDSKNMLMEHKQTEEIQALECNDNVIAKNMLMEHKQSEEIQELECNDNGIAKRSADEIDHQTSLKENEQSSCISYNNDENYPHVIQDTGPNHEIMESVSIIDFDNYGNKNKEAVKTCETKKLCLYECYREKENFMDKNITRFEVDQCEDERNCLDNPVIHKLEKMEIIAETKDISKNLKTILDNLNSKSIYSCKKSKIRNGKFKGKSYEKCFKHKNNNCVTKFLERTSLRVVQSIRKKYHNFELSKKIKAMNPEMVSKQRFLKRKSKLKNKSSKIIMKKVCVKKITNVENAGVNYVPENDSVTKDFIPSNVNEIYLVSHENKKEVENDEVLGNLAEIHEDISLLPVITCLSRKKTECKGHISPQNLHYIGTDETLDEENIDSVILTMEEKEVVVGGLEEGYMIGNDEVLVRTEGSSIEEKDSRFPIEEDTVGIQYWNSYELGNSLGVAMEVEVGSEIEYDADTILLQPIKVGSIADSEDNDKSVNLPEETLNSELLEVSAHEELTRVGMDKVYDQKEEIKPFCSKKTAQEENDDFHDKAKSFSFFRKDNKLMNDSVEDTNTTESNFENSQIYEGIEPNESSSPRNSLLKNTPCSLSVKDSKQNGKLSFLLNSFSGRLMKKGPEISHNRVALENDSVKLKSECTYQDTGMKRNSSDICNDSHSITSKNKRHLNRIKRKSKTIIEGEAENDVLCPELSNPKLSSKAKSPVKRGSSVNIFSPKKKTLYMEKNDRSDAEINIKKIIYGEDVVKEVWDDEGAINKNKSHENSDCKEVPSEGDESKKQVINDTSNFIYEHKENKSIVSNVLKESNCKSSFSSFEEKNKESWLSSKEIQNTILDNYKEVSENNHLSTLKSNCLSFDTNHGKIKVTAEILVSGKEKQKMKNKSSHCCKGLNVKETQSGSPKLSSNTAVKNYHNVHGHLLKSVRNGFWKNRKWPFNKKYNKHSKHQMPLKKSSSKVSASVLVMQDKNPLPQILESYPTPPLLSPLPVLTESVSSISYDSSSPKSFSEKSHTQKICVPSFIEDQYSKEPSETVWNESKSASLHHLDEDSNAALPSFPMLCPNSSNNASGPSFKTSFITEAMSKDCMVPKLQKSETKYIEETTGITNLSEVNSGEISSFKSISSETNHVLDSDQYSSVKSTPHQKPNPRVYLTCKKVEIDDRNEKWMKTSIQDESSSSQDEVRKGELKQNKIDHTFESPLPKVTIKKKNGEKGYQSFLSGFSSCSPSSAPVTSIPHDLMPLKSEPFDMVEHENVAQENSISESMKSKSFETPMQCDVNSRDIQEIAHRTLAVNEVNNGMVEKKAGSRLVFVIRGFSNQVKEDSPKDFVTEQIDVSHDNIKTSDRNSHSLDISEHCLSSEDEGWESGPWSIWQPVVKLSRCCELDALARELHSMGEDNESGESFPNPSQHSKSSINKFTDTSSQETKDKSGFNSENPMKVSNIKESEDVKTRLKKKDSERKIETEKQQSNVKKDPSLDDTKKRKSGIVSQRTSKKGSSRKGSDDALLNADKIEGKKIHHNERNSCLDFEVLNESTKQINIYSDNEESNLMKSKSPLPTTSSRIKSGKISYETKKEKLLEDVHIRKEKEERLLIPESKIKKENFFDCGSDAIRNSSSCKKIPKGSSKVNRPKLKGSCRRSKAIDMEKERQNEKSNVLSFMQALQVKILSKEKLPHSTHHSGKDASRSTQKQGRRTPLFQCESCCRRFTSEKWLNRHCKGVSHLRVENAQRVAVQALLLLLTGDESKLLRPLSEIELSHLKTWPSHSAPSPLQVALNELLHPAKDHLI